MCINTTHAKFGVNGYSYMETFPEYLLQFCDCNRTTPDKNSSLRMMRPTPSKSPARGGTKRLTQSVKHRWRVIPRKAHPAREWGIEPPCWCSPTPSLSMAGISGPISQLSSENNQYVKQALSPNRGLKIFLGLGSKKNASQ